MTLRLIFLLTVFVLGFGATYALQHQKLSIRPTAMPGQKLKRDEFGGMMLPTLIGTFIGGAPLPAGKQEREVLAADTGFSKRQYTRRNYDHKPRQTVDPAKHEGDYELITASVVTAGSEMGSSIHRPERCLTAQGHNLAPSKPMTVSVKGKQLPITKIQAVKQERLQYKDGTEAVVDRHSVLYYWFVGNDSVTGSHMRRTVHDLSARLTTGTDQEWAYASVSIPLDPQPIALDENTNAEDAKDYILLRKIDDQAVDEQGLTDADRVAYEFIADFVAEVVDEKMIKAWQ